MERLMAIILAVLTCAAAKGATLPQSGDIVSIGDFQYVIVSRGDWEKLSAIVDDLRTKWYAANSNEQGRVAFHGKRGHMSVTNGVISVEYADGFVYTEAAADNSTRAARKTDAVEKPQAKVSATVDAPKAVLNLRDVRKTAKATTNIVTRIIRRGLK